jgi:hypothetical protein
MKFQFFFISDQNIMRPQICFQVPDPGNILYSRFTFWIVAAIHDRLSWLRPCWSEPETTRPWWSGEWRRWAACAGLSGGGAGASVLLRQAAAGGGVRQRERRCFSPRPLFRCSVLVHFSPDQSDHWRSGTVFPTYFAVKKKN